ncbi:MAG: hypothetical protein ACJAQ6_000248 [Arenicella sp.]|jgi:hypothetical protein
MKFKQITVISLIALSVLVTACNDAPEQAKAPEPVDIHATELLNDKLLESMRGIRDEQLDQVESAGKNALQELSEADRQSLIDLTIDESAEAVSEDAGKMIELLEDVNGISN